MTLSILILNTAVALNISIALYWLWLKTRDLDFNFFWSMFTLFQGAILFVAWIVYFRVGK